MTGFRDTVCATGDGVLAGQHSGDNDRAVESEEQLISGQLHHSLTFGQHKCVNIL